MTTKTPRIPPPEDCPITIVAGRTSPPTCLLTWGDRELALDCGTVRQLATDMVAAAARAEAEAAVVATLRRSSAEDKMIGAFLVDVRSHYAAYGFGIKNTLTLVPGVSLFDGHPFVHANIAPYEPQRIDPETLRTMAAQWTGTAEAAERDAILTYALADATDLTPDQIDSIFVAMRTVRPDGLQDDAWASPGGTA